MAFDIEIFKKSLQEWKQGLHEWEQDVKELEKNFSTKYDTWDQTLNIIENNNIKPSGLKAMKEAYKSGRNQASMALKLKQIATIAADKGLELYVENSPESKGGKILKLIPIKLISQMESLVESAKSTDKQNEEDLAQLERLVKNAPTFNLHELDKFGRTISQHVNSQSHEVLTYSRATGDIMSVQKTALTLNKMLGALQKVALPSDSVVSDAYFHAYKNLAKQIRRIERSGLESMQMLSANRTKNLQLNKDLQGNFNASNAYSDVAQFYSALSYDIVPYIDELWAEFHTTNEFKKRYGHKAVYKKTADVVAFQRDFADLIDTAIMYAQVNNGQELFDSYIKSGDMAHFKVAAQRLDKLFKFIQQVQPTYGIRSDAATGRLTLSKIQTATSPFIPRADRKLTQNNLGNTLTERKSGFVKKNPFKPLLPDIKQSPGETAYYLRGEATQADIFKAYEIYINGDKDHEGIGKIYGFSWDKNKHTIVFNKRTDGRGNLTVNTKEATIKQARNGYNNLLQEKPWLENYKLGLVNEQGFFRSSLLDDLSSTYLDPKVIKPTDYQKIFDELSSEERAFSEDQRNLLIAKRFLGRLAPGTRILTEQPGPDGKNIPAITRTAEGGLNLVLEQKLRPHALKLMGGSTGGVRLSGVALDDDIVNILIDLIYGGSKISEDAKKIGFIRQKGMKLSKDTDNKIIGGKIASKNIYNYLDEAFRFLGIKIEEKWEKASAEDKEELVKTIKQEDLLGHWLKKVEVEGDKLLLSEKPFNKGKDDIDLAIETLNKSAETFIDEEFKFFIGTKEDGYSLAQQWIGAGELNPASNERARNPRQIEYGPKEARALEDSLSIKFNGAEIFKFAPYLKKVKEAPFGSEYAAKDEKGRYTGFYAAQLQNMQDLAFKTMGGGAEALKTMTLLDDLFSDINDIVSPGTEDYLSTTGQIYMSRSRVESLPSFKLAQRIINDVQNDIKEGKFAGLAPDTDFLSALEGPRKADILQSIIKRRYGIDLKGGYFTNYLNGKPGEEGYGAGQQMPLFADLDLIKSVYGIMTSNKADTDNVLLNYSKMSSLLDRFALEYKDILQRTDLSDLQKQKEIGDNVAALMETAVEEVAKPEGTYYEKYHKISMPGSRMFNSRSLNAVDDDMDFIMGVSNWKALMHERLNSLSLDEAELELRNALTNAEINTDDSKTFKTYLDAVKSGNDKQRGQYRAKILNEITKNVVHGKGFVQMLFNRQPSITGSDTMFARGRLSYGKQFGDSIAFNPYFQRILNADDDGDIIASMVISANKEEFERAYEFTKNAKLVSKILQAEDLGMQDQEANNFKTLLEKYTSRQTGKGAKDARDKDIFVAKQVQEGKRAIGLFSEANNAMRNVLVQRGLSISNWSNLTQADGDIFPGSGILYGDVLTSFLAVLEQDAISAKKMDESFGKNAKKLTKTKQKESEDWLTGIQQIQKNILKAENWRDASSFKTVLSDARKILGVKDTDNILNNRMMTLMTAKAFTIGGDYWKKYLSDVLGYKISKKDDLGSQSFLEKIADQIGDKTLTIKDDDLIRMFYGTDDTNKRFALTTRLGQATQGGKPITLSEIISNPFKYKSPTSIPTWIGQTGYDLMSDKEKDAFIKYYNDPGVQLASLVASGKYDTALANQFTLTDWSNWALGNPSERYQNLKDHLEDTTPFFKSFHGRAKSLGLSDYQDSDIGRQVLSLIDKIGNEKYKGKFALLKTVDDLTEDELQKLGYAGKLTKKERENLTDFYRKEYLSSHKYNGTEKNKNEIERYVNQKLADEEKKRINDIRQEKLDEKINKDFVTEFENLQASRGPLGKIDNPTLKSELPLLIATVKGNLVHYTAEAAAKLLQRKTTGPDIQKTVMGAVKKNPDYIEAESQLVKLLRLSGMTTEEIEKERQKALTRTAAQVAGSLGGIKSENIIGAEVDIFGQHGTRLEGGSGGTADLLYRDDDNNIVVYDYKNTKTGVPVASHFMQVLQYMQDVDTLKTAIAETGGNLTAEEFLNTKYGKKQLTFYRDRAATMLQREKDKGRRFTKKQEEDFLETYYNEQVEQFLGTNEFTGTYDAIVNTINANEGADFKEKGKNTKVLGKLGYTSASGVWSQYLLDLQGNQILQGALNKFNAGYQFNSEDLKEIANASKLLESRMIQGYHTDAQTKEFKEYLVQLEAEEKLKNDIYVLEERQQYLEANGRIESAKALDKRISQLKEELEIKKSETEKGKEAVKESNKQFNKRQLAEVEEEQKDLENTVKQSQALAAATKAEEDRAEIDTSLAKEYIKEYKELAPSKTKIDLRKKEIQRTLKDKTALITTQERGALKEELNSLDDSLNDYVLKRLEELSNLVLKRSASGEVKDRFKKVKADLDKQYADAIAKDKLMGDENYRRGKYKEQRVIEHKIEGVLNQEAEAENRLKLLNMQISRGAFSNENEKRILELEREKARVYYEDTVNQTRELMGEYTNKKGKLDPRFKQVYDKVNDRILIEKEIRQLKQDEADREAMSNNGLFGGVGRSFSTYLKRFTGATLIMRVMAKLRQEVQKVINQAKELDQVMTNVRIVTNGSIEDTRNLMSEYSQLGKELGITTKEVAQAGIAWMRQGYQAAEATKLITASLYLSKLGMIDNATATKSLTSALKGFKLEAAEAMSVVDKLTAIDLKAATSAGDIAEGLAQFANLGSLAGVDIDQAAAYVATIADVTQMSGSSAGQALKTIISRFGNVKAGAYNKLNVDAETTDAGENLNDVEKVLNKIGISIRDTNLQFKDFDDVLAEIAEKWNSLDNVSKKAIANAFAGIRQQESFVTLLENWDKYEELLDVSRNSKGTAEMKYQSYQESLQASAEKLQATIEDLINKAEISSLLKVLTDLSQGMLEYLPKIIHWIPAIISTIENMKLLTGSSIIQRILNNSSTKEGGMLFNTLKRFNSAKHGYYAMEDFYKSSGEKHPKGKAGARSLWEFMFGGETRDHRTATLAAEEKANKQITKEAERQVALSKKESQEKAKVAKDATIEKTAKKEEVSLATQELVAGKDKLNLTTLESMVARGELSTEQAIEKYRKQGGKSEREVEKLRKLGEKAEGRVYRERSKPEGGEISTKANFSKILGIAGTTLSFMVNQAIAAVSAYETAGLSHKDSEGNTVTSSETAHIAGRNITTAMSLIPVIGQPIGELIASKVMKEIDAARDEASLVTQKANNRLNALKGMQADFETIKKLAGSQKINDVTERNNAITSYINTMYLSENTELRHIIESYLSGISEDVTGINGNSLTLNSLMARYQNADGKTQKQIVRALEIAQKKAELSQQQAARASENYAYTEKIREAKLTYNKYNETQNLSGKYGIAQSQVDKAHGIGAASGIGIGMASGAAVGALIGTHATPLIGTIVGALVGAVAGAVGGVLTRNQLIEKYKAAESISDISLKDLENQRAAIITKIDELNGNLNENTESNEELLGQYQQQLTAIEELTTAIKDRNVWVNNYTAQQNELILEEGLLEAKVKNANGQIVGYLNDMSVGQLWAMNPDDILKAYGDVVKDRLMGGVSVYVKDSDGNDTTELSAEFIKLALKAFKSDDELQQRFTARDLTLNEALLKLNADNWLDKQQLQTFADALHVPISGLDSLTDKFGKLKLSDMLKTTTDLNEEMKKYSELMSSVTDGTASVSSWITTIIQQFPELMQYTNDIPTLMNEIMIKISQLNTRYLEATWEEFADSKEYFTQIQPKILEQIPENQRQKAQDYLNALSNSSISGLMSYLSGADMGDEANQALKEAFIKIMESETVVSDLAKESQKQYFEFRVAEMNQVLENLTQQRDMLKEINHQREYENRLLEARNKLETAQTEKSRRYRAGVGWVYEADQEKIQEAEDNLKEIENEKDISALTKQIEILTAERDEWSTVWEKQSYALQQEMAKQYEAAFGVDGTLTSALTAVSQSMGSLAEAILKEKTDQRNRLLYGIENNKKTEDSLAELWNKYVSARGTPRENDALSLYTERAQKASAAGIDLSEWAKQEKEHLTSISGTENAEMLEPVDVATNPDAYRPAVAQRFVLSGGGNVASTGEMTLEYARDPLTDASSLWRDIQASGDDISAENKHRQDYARLWVLDKDGNPVDAGDFRELKKGYYAEYAPRGVRDLYGYATQLTGIAGFNGAIIGGFSDDQNKWAYIDSQGKIWSLDGSDVPNIMTNKETNKQKRSSFWKAFLDGLAQSSLSLPSHANGTLATSGEMSLINELGTEAIITPQGTITALPGHTGIIPADITKNLWSLGELSPSILRALQMNILPDKLKPTSSMGSITDQSLNISTLNMNVNADNSFDPQQFVQALKAQVALTRHLR